MNQDEFQVPFFRRLGETFSLSLDGKIVSAVCEGRSSDSCALINAEGEYYMERGQELIKLDDSQRCSSCSEFKCVCEDDPTVSESEYKPRKPTVRTNQPENNMQIKLITKVGPNLLVEVFAADIKDAIKDISFFNELAARSGGKCGLCESENVSLRHRSHEANDFFELACGDCGGQYAIGQRKDGGLYPRGDKETGGWSKFQKQARNDDHEDRKSKPAPKKQSTSDDWD